MTTRDIYIYIVYIYQPKKAYANTNKRVQYKHRERKCIECKCIEYKCIEYKCTRTTVEPKYHWLIHLDIREFSAIFCHKLKENTGICVSKIPVYW